MNAETKRPTSPKPIERPAPNRETTTSPELDKLADHIYVILSLNQEEPNLEYILAEFFLKLESEQVRELTAFQKRHKSCDTILQAYDLLVPIHKELTAKHEVQIETLSKRNKSTIQYSAQLKQENAELTAERDRFKTALEGLVRKLEQVEKDSVYVYQQAAIHGFPYNGADYGKELQVAQAALKGETE